MIQTIIGRKLGQIQGFLEDGKRIPMTRIDVSGIVVSQLKTSKKDGYDAVQLGYGTTTKADKPTIGHSNKAGLTSTPRFFKESRVDKMDGIEVGSAVIVEEILSAGDIVDVSGTSKGKGYAGVVKRHHFKGGPKTHGQSDRHRAPGSIGQSTTPGRVYKGKRMAGHMGVDQKTIKNLEVIDLADGILVVKGLVPGHISSIVTITRRGVNKKHIGLYKEAVEEEAILDTSIVEEIGPSVEEQEAQRLEVKAETVVEEKAERQAQGKTEEATGSTNASEERIEEAPEASVAAEAEVISEKNETIKEPTLAESMMTEEEKKGESK